MDMIRTMAQTTHLMGHLLIASMGITRIPRMNVHPTGTGAQIISMMAFLLASVPGSGGDLDRGSGAGFTISMTSVGLAVSEATASETSGTKEACEAGGAVTPTVAAASEAERPVVIATEDSVVADSVAERPVAVAEDSAADSVAERPVAVTEDSAADSVAERPVAATEDSAADSVAERPVAATEDSAADSVAERPVVAEGSVAAVVASEAEHTVVAASEAGAAAATAVDTAKSLLS
jgi:hypothetical protein